MNPENIALYFKQGSSDKVYQAALTQETLGWMVRFEYGRRGSTLRAGVKTKTPVSYETAKKAYDQLVASKTAKGYTPSGTGVAYLNTPAAGRVTGYIPQLLNDISQEELEELFKQLPGGALALQTKHNGERRGIIIQNDKTIYGANRKGLEIAFRKDIYKALSTLNESWPHGGIFDAEDMGDHLVIFDILKLGITSQLHKSFKERAQYLVGLSSLIQKLHLQRQLVVDVPTYPSSLFHLRKFINLARSNNEEGIVIRITDAPYVPGRPNSGGTALKLKFKATATVIVQSNHPTKRSIGIAIFDGISEISIGNCTVTTKHDIPPIGSLVEIQYLYAYRGGSLFQPVYKGLRNDLDKTAATFSQLKFKD